MAPPGLVVIEGLRIVVLPRAGHGGEGEVLVHEVDAERVLPVAEALHVLKAQLPARAAVGFAQRAAAAHLVGHARKFLHRAHVAELRVDVFAELVEEHVDGRHVVPGVHGHVVGAVAVVGPVVLPVVAGPGDALLLRVAVPGLGPALDEEIEQQRVVVVADLAPVAGVFEQGDELGLEVVAEALLELREEVGGPAHGVAAGRGDLGLVGEDAGDGFADAEIRAERALVAGHGDFDELFGDAGQEEIHVGEAAVPAALLVIRSARSSSSCLRAEGGPRTSRQAVVA